VNGKDVADFVNQNFIKHQEKYDWFSKMINGEVTEQSAKYFAESPLYLNEVALYQATYLRNYLGDLRKYQLQALECYLTLAQILGHPYEEDIMPFQFNVPSPEERKEYEGKYHTSRFEYFVEFDNFLKVSGGINFLDGYHMIERDTFQGFLPDVTLLFERNEEGKIISFKEVTKLNTYLYLKNE
jgi:hypothetical protein